MPYMDKASAGKGSSRREETPEGRQAYQDNYDRIFGRKKFNIHSSGKKETIGVQGATRGVDMGTDWKRPAGRAGYTGSLNHKG